MKEHKPTWASILPGIGLIVASASAMAAGEVTISNLPVAPLTENPVCHSAAGQLGPCSATIPVENVIWVATSGGDFNDPVAAVNSISGATADNPYLVMVGPGTYTLSGPLVMKQHVYIEGSGRNLTMITGSFSDPNPVGSWDISTLIKGSNNSGLKDLTVENTCSGALCTVIYNNAASPGLNGIIARAVGGTNTIAIHNNAGASPTLKTVTAIAEGNGGSMGMYSYNNCEPSIDRSKIVAQGAGANYGVFNKGASTATIHHSVVSASTNTIVNDGTSGASYAKIFSSKLHGGNVLAQLGGAAPVCAYVTDENYTESSWPTCP